MGKGKKRSLRKAMKGRGGFFRRGKEKPHSPPGEVTPVSQKRKRHRKHK